MKTFEEFTKEDLWALRNQVCVGSIYIADYCNSFGIDAHSVCDFFDGWLDFLQEQMRDDMGEEYDDNKFFDYLEAYDNAEKLEEWFYCFDNFDWVKYEPEEDEEDDWSWLYAA